MFKTLFHALVLLLIVLLFVGGANDESSRLTKAIWDTGHLFLFSGLAWLLMDAAGLKTQKVLSQFLWLAVFVVLVGGGVEVLQLFVGRYCELMDVLFDALGALTGWLLYLAWRKKITFLLQVSPLIVMSVLIVFGPVWLAYQDQSSMRDDFPVLADFENKNELARWELNDARILLQPSHVRHGGSALAVNFGMSEYPGIALHQMVSDWRNYRYLKLNVFNPQKSAARLSLKIYDHQHPHNDYAYRDRFNANYDLKPGWNALEVALEDVRQAPKGRQMNMADIVDISLFLQDQTQPVLLYLDYLRLSQ